jgi:hypothetical protein
MSSVLASVVDWYSKPAGAMNETVFFGNLKHHHFLSAFESSIHWRKSRVSM